MKTRGIHYLLLALTAVVLGAGAYVLDAPSDVVPIVARLENSFPSAETGSPGTEAFPRVAVALADAREPESFSNTSADSRRVAGRQAPALRLATSPGFAPRAQRTVSPEVRRAPQPSVHFAGASAGDHPVETHETRRIRARVVAGAGFTPRAFAAGGRQEAFTAEVAAADFTGPALRPAILAAEPETDLSAVQSKEWERLEEEFVEQIGGPGQDPADPAYRQRWFSAQELSDIKFQVKFGTEAFLRFNIEAGRRGSGQ